MQKKKILTFRPRLDALDDRLLLFFFFTVTQSSVSKPPLIWFSSMDFEIISCFMSEKKSLPESELHGDSGGVDGIGIFGVSLI